MKSQRVLKEEKLLIDGDFVVADALFERYNELKVRRKRELDDQDIAVAEELEERYKVLNQNHYSTVASDKRDDRNKVNRLSKRSVKDWTIEIAVFADNAMYRYVREKYPGEDIREVVKLIFSLPSINY